MMTLNNESPKSGRPARCAAFVAAAFLAGAGSVSSAGVGAATEAARSIRLDIPAQSMATALLRFSEQTGIQVTSRSAPLQVLNTSGVRGEYRASEALEILLKGSGLTYKFIDDETVVVQQIAAVKPPTIAMAPVMEPVDTSGHSDRIAVAAGQPQAVDRGSASPSATQASHEVVVTGTRLKGVKDQFFPVTQISREKMDLAGYQNISEVFDDLPQNFGGGTTLDTSTAGGVAGAGAASVNLRGLGNEGTLILLNGRRLAPGGLNGGFVDISSIPTSAIDRIEIVSDGASAIYGSDAIAGVVNILLRTDFEGAETRAALSTITDGGGDTVKIGQTVGGATDRAHGLLTYEYSSEGELKGSAKDFAARAIQPTWLLPLSRKHNLLVSGGLSLSDRLNVSADAYYNRRDTEHYTSTFGSSLFQIRQPVQIDQYGAALGATLELRGDWETNLSASHSYSKHDSTQLFLHTALGSFDKDDSTGDISAFDATVGGSLFRIADEAVKAVLGAHHRIERVDQLSVSSVGGGGAQFQAKLDREVSAVFGELYVPLVSQANALPGVRRFALTAAARYDDYSDVGTSFDPKVGLVWSPVEGLNLRGTYGTSFRAARLEQMRNSITSLILAYYIDPGQPGGKSVSLSISGSTGQLAPEQAETWTAGFDFSPPGLEALRLRGTYFSVVYDDRIGFPGTSVFFDTDGSFNYRNYTGMIERNPSPARVQELVSRSPRLIDATSIYPVGGPLSLANVTVILDGSPQNLSASQVEGVDFETGYAFSTRLGDWNLSLNSTYLLKYTQQTAPSLPVRDLLNTFRNPIDLKLRGGLLWSGARTSAGLYVNYSDRYTDDQAAGGAVPIDSWMTLDATMHWDLEKWFGGGVAKGASLVFSASNLLNEDPPAIGSRGAQNIYVYDATNADPAGRRVGVLFTKAW